MTNDEIGEVFRNIGNLLQIKGDDSFRARIYDRAAETIDELSVDLHRLAEEGTLRSIPGIGKAIEQKIIEMLETGRCRFHDNLIDEMGPDVLDLIAIRGVGVKTAGRFYNELGVKGLSDLRAAIDADRLTQMKRMGAKTIASIDEGLRFLEAQRKLRPLRQILPIAAAVFDALKNCPDIKRLDFTGDFRRHEEMLQSLELVAECGSAQAIVEVLSEVKGVVSPAIEDNVCVVASVDRGFPLRVYCTSAAEYEATLVVTTGADAHQTQFNQIALSQGIEPIGEPLPDWSKNRTEADIYGQLGLPFIVPELRDNADSLEAASADNLPTLIEQSDLRCDLHMHTDWSDGRGTIRQMVETAASLGHEYIAITDHSESSRVANGLTPERLSSQIQQVREINTEVDGMEVLAGSEVDIRKDGSLDFPDELLAQLDIVIASVHEGLSMSESEMTDRIIRAIENPYVTIIGHPTGRLLGRRPGYAVNLEAVIDAAAAHGVALEINAAPSRLDLEPSSVRQARDRGVLLSVNTDAHSIPDLERVLFGINVARRGWLEKTDVLNTYSLATVKEMMAGRVRGSE
ncbi:DNA polymerase/3'-5' exonuclease PolX [Candidatus Poribacteria bacterium]|nr:DNA polymerase/3'-5' exonuclease PolX [Candidatus Poribacteria bacterium]